ncbi:transposase [Pseudonocardia sp. K10HN5]|uniref:Transposase n=1 Tax=Pseudonocardia acidicola TaxID=2724939 RepID=A0ABX1SAZ8_9PSEU|nr:transposase [Pseudonocardia acidicola]
MHVHRLRRASRRRRAAPSVGTVGDADDNALAESTIGLFKTELIKPRGPWRSVEQVEIATLEYVDRFTTDDSTAPPGDIPPTELETAHYRQRARQPESQRSNR